MLLMHRVNVGPVFWANAYCNLGGSNGGGGEWEEKYPETVDTLEIDTLKTIRFFLGCLFFFPWAFAVSFSDV